MEKEGEKKAFKEATSLDKDQSQRRKKKKRPDTIFFLVSLLISGFKKIILITYLC